MWIHVVSDIKQWYEGTHRVQFTVNCYVYVKYVLPMCTLCRLPVAILWILLQELLKLLSADDLSTVPDFTELKPEARFAVLLYHRW